MNTKQCSKCKEIKPATSEYFSRDKKHRDGLFSQCKVCAAEYGRAHRTANKEHYAEYQRTYYAATKEQRVATRRAYIAANRERIRERRRAYYAENMKKRFEYNATHKGRAAENSRAHYIANKARILEQRRAYAAANKEAIRAKHHRRRARKVHAEGTHTAADIKRQYKAQKGRCYYCHIKVGDKFHADHVIPLSRGGSDGPENIVVTCPACNVSKNNKLPHEWPQGGRLL